MTVQPVPPIKLNIVGARGENIYDTVRRLGLGGAAADASDASAAAAYALYITDNFDGTDLAATLAAASIAQTYGSIWTTPFEALQASAPVSPSDGDKYINTTDQKGYIRVSGAWIGYTPLTGQIIFNQGDSFPYQYSGSAWLKRHSKIAFSSQFATLAAAATFAASAGVRLVIDADSTLSASVSISSAVPAVSFDSAKITLGNFDLTFNGQALRADREQIFVYSGTGRVKGNFKARGSHVEWWGAKSDNTSGAATSAAFQYVYDFHAQTETAGGIIYCLGKDYATDNATTVVKASSFQCPRLIGNGNNETTIHFSPTSDTPFLQLVGGAGAFTNGGVEDLRITGNSHLIPIDVRDLGGLYCSYRVTVAKCAALVESFASSGFSEHDRFKLQIDDMATCPVVLDFDTVSGTGSFKETGLVEGTVISASTGYGSVLRVGTGCQPYQTPFYFSFFAAGGTWTMVENNSANDVVTRGSIAVELLSGSITLSTGSGATFRQMNKSIASGASLIFGNSKFATIAGNDSGISADNDAFIQGETATPQFLSAGTGASTTITADIPFNRTSRYTLSLVGSGYVWSGEVLAIDNSSGTKAFVPNGHLFTGSNAPTFSSSGGKLVITVADAISASTISIFWKKQIPNEFAH